MGGVNHTLTSRGNITMNDPDIFQQPPQSISWLFDRPAMVIGIDVSHPDLSKGEKSSSPSIVAVVASMDGMVGQYAAHIGTCHGAQEPVASLGHAFKVLLQRFFAVNDTFPERIIVYRDGVADGQFGRALDSELGCLRAALAEFDRADLDAVSIAFVVCQKRHHTRLFYQQAGPGGAPPGDFLNPCVGLCVDGRGFNPNGGGAGGGATGGATGGGGPDEIGCIVGGNLNEFYLNSHAAVLGTSKPTKYILLYDDIGFKMSELQLFTFWLTHLYGRCTRSVSVAAPAYYAHWAARRGKVLLQGGANPHSLHEWSTQWIDGDDHKKWRNGMYFI
jgi:eukaryotic translation initiation factor 2C